MRSLKQQEVVSRFLNPLPMSLIGFSHQGLNPIANDGPYLR